MLRDSAYRFSSGVDGMVRLEASSPGPYTRSHAARRGVSPGNGTAASAHDVKAIVERLDDATLAELPGLPGGPAGSGRRRSQRRAASGGGHSVLDGDGGIATAADVLIGSPWRSRRCSRPTSISDGNVNNTELLMDHSYGGRFNHRTFPKEFTNVAWFPGDEFATMTWQYRCDRGLGGVGSGVGGVGGGVAGKHHDNHYRNHSAGASPYYLGHPAASREELVSSVDNLLGNGVVGDRCWLVGYPRNCASEANVVTWSDRVLPAAPPPPTSSHQQKQAVVRQHGQDASSQQVWENMEMTGPGGGDDESDSISMEDSGAAQRKASRRHHVHPQQCRCGCDPRDSRSLPVHQELGLVQLMNRQQAGKKSPVAAFGHPRKAEEISAFPPDHSAKSRQEMTFYPRRRGSNSTSSTSVFSLTSKHRLFIMVLLLLAAATGIGVPLAMRIQAGASLEERLEMAARLLRETPLIDGHNDLPWNIRQYVHNKLHNFRFSSDLRQVAPWGSSSWSHTDLPRLRKGHVAAQFWAAYVPCQAQFRDAVQLTLEQVDLIKRLTERYNPHLTWCTSTDHIREAHSLSQVCSLVGVEGGHSLGNSLAVLRMLYDVGVRYLTLTSTCNTPWADSAQVEEAGSAPEHGGLTNFGRTVVKEMNRLGMLVDLSHVSVATMRDALEVSRAPVFFSHSSARALCNSSRNVPDHILGQLANNRGLVMVNFYSHFLSCSEFSTVEDAVAHINHIRDVAGVDHVGLGAGFDGINATPRGLEDVSSYPVLFAELIRSGKWSAEDLKKLAGQNFLRVMREVEKVRDAMSENNVGPFEDTIATKHLRGRNNCTSVLHFTRPRDQSRPSQDAP